MLHIQEKTYLLAYHRQILHQKHSNVKLVNIRSNHTAKFPTHYQL